jgi:twitching motility protein PilI
LSKRVSLKDFQEGLAARLKAAAGEAAHTARLSFEAGDSAWLLKLEGSGEVLQVPEIQRVPLTREWFLGMANIRGLLYGVSDLAGLLGQGATVRGPNNRLLLVGRPHSINAALLVTRLTGLRNVQQMHPVDDPGDGSEARWAERVWRDPEGRIWRELDVAKLVAHRDFLEVAAQGD